jgi:hypothetical protein
MPYGVIVVRKSTQINNLLPSPSSAAPLKGRGYVFANTYPGNQVDSKVAASAASRIPCVLRFPTYVDRSSCQAPPTCFLTLMTIFLLLFTVFLPPCSAFDHLPFDDVKFVFKRKERRGDNMSRYKTMIPRVSVFAFCLVFHYTNTHL